MAKVLELQRITEEELNVQQHSYTNDIDALPVAHVTIMQKKKKTVINFTSYAKPMQEKNGEWQISYIPMKMMLATKSPQ